MENGREVGHMTSEQRLDDLTKIHREASRGSGTKDMVVCARNGDRQQCFPFRWGITSAFFPAFVDGKALPLTRAVSGETATEITTDFRRERVVAALGPIGNTGLGMAVKRDMADLYAPIRKQFFNTLPFLVLLIFASIAITRAKLQPLVESLNQASEKMKAMALTDALTGLPNRLLFNDRLQSPMMRSKRSKNTMALMFIDLNKFKAVNDRYGHNIGDDLLKWCGSELNSAVRESDSVARIGGDEFTIILENLPNVEIVERLAQNIVDAIGRYKIAFPAINVADFGVSIGIALYKDDSRLPKDLMESADSELYACKKSGRASFQITESETTLIA
jgi:diguanylate cyclase (GGDEF)-like protein